MTLSIRHLLHAGLILLFIACFAAIYAQGDSASYHLRRFDQSALQRYSGQEYIYDKKPPAENDIMGWLWYKFLQLLDRLFSPRQQVNAVRIVMYLLMIGAIIAIILNLMGIKVGRFLARDAQMVIAPQIGEENIREMNMDELIADAASKKQWRLSMRYQYLKALRLLTDRELIHWQVGKTNMDYYYELREDTLKNLFLAATDDFENAWYGNSAITEEHYRESKTSLENFYSQIQSYPA